VYLSPHTAFVLSHELTLSVHSTEAVGSLIDSVIAIGGDSLVVREIVWKALKEEDAKLNAIREGREQGDEICKRFGKKLVEIVSVEELDQPEEEG